MELRRLHMRGSGSVCRDCMLVLRHAKRGPAIPQPMPTTAIATRPWTRRSITTATAAAISAASSNRPRPSPPKHSYAPQRYPASTSAPPAHTPDLNALHTRIEELSASVLKPESDNRAVRLPEEQRVLYVLEQLQAIAASVLDAERVAKPESVAARGAPASENARGGRRGNVAGGKRQQETATSALLGSVNARQYPAFVSRASILNMLSEKAFEIVRHPHVFVTAPILRAYVELQSLLQQPWSFPDVFDAYARKPAPTVKGNAVEYSPVSPNHMNAAIDSKTANTALSAAMLTHNLPLAIDIITTSFCAPAFKRAKMLKQAAIPIGGLAIAPLAAYTLSSSFSSLQQTMDPSMATGVAFAGIMTYVGAVGMVGYVAITTANDQMDRITWASGVPLWERWLREDERAAADRVAAAWGFKNRDRRGEEEGEDWETLREWVGLRGMVLDRVNLMDGME